MKKFKRKVAAENNCVTTYFEVHVNTVAGCS